MAFSLKTFFAALALAAVWRMVTAGAFTAQSQPALGRGNIRRFGSLDRQLSHGRHSLPRIGVLVRGAGLS
ncbi:hypothetical protein [Dyella koreensis]|uniref:hypothetical protein n=1 Tax=Dyella koreensis TaxID=311235 RepID=UPI0036121D5D